MSNIRAAARDTLIAGVWAVLFIASLSGMRYVNSLEHKDTNFASWQLRGTVVAD